MIAPRALIPALLGLLATAGCTHKLVRFPLAPPLWEDPDRNHVPRQPGKYYSGAYADIAEQSILRPLSELFAFKLAGQARNVNSVDEVPNSSWFTNRIGLHPLSPAQAARGPCRAPLDPKGPWLVTGAKPDGANPGFFIKARTGTYLLKFDGALQPERATAADVIGSKIYWAAGYFTPCNEIVYFRREILRIKKGAKARSEAGREVPLAPRHLDQVLRSAVRTKEGWIRASASRFVPGKPLGPFRYEGTRADDPNDVIPHEDRRELRGQKLLAAWIQHFDSREQNSLDVWVRRRDRTYIRHYLIDWGDCFGNRNLTWEGLAKRVGHSYFIDRWDMLVDLVTLGAYPRPWYRARINPEAEIFGYYGVKDFVPSGWKPIFQNPAFERMDFADALWMVRILSRFTDAHIRAIVRTGKLSNRRAERYLVRTLIARRNRILSEYLTRYAPLDRFRLVRRQPGQPAQSLCFEDLAVKHRLVDPAHVVYKMRFYGGKPPRGLRQQERSSTRLRPEYELGWLQFQPDPRHAQRSCVVLPLGDKRPADSVSPGAADDHELRYGVLKIFIHQKPAVPPTSSIWLHFYDLGPGRGFRLVGIRRRPKPVTPETF